MTAVRNGFEQAFGVAAFLAVIGVAVALLLPGRLSEARSAAHRQEEADAIIQKAVTTDARD